MAAGGWSENAARPGGRGPPLRPQLPLGCAVRPPEDRDEEPAEAEPPPLSPLLREDELGLERDPPPFEEELAGPRV